MITQTTRNSSLGKPRRARRCLAFTLTGLVAVSTAVEATIATAQTPAKTMSPDGEPTQISDWAYAGLLWSNASLTKKAAFEGLRQTDNEELAERYRAIAIRS